ncbi:MAG: DNA polymerase III subunit gamma/tau [Bacteroidales bacterium]|nr:DNA polymerase III subunit gamma/tau [Bacteroidales bacterium]
MSQYIVSARKYRPDSFETLIGQDTIAKTLSNSIKRGQLAHAYLFCGPRGVGKTTTARIFAKMINCSNPGPDMEPCGECESCVSFKEGRSYCIHELDAASNNSVEDIKALMDQVQVPPQVGKYSVYIIDEVHMLSAAAFNAFLKTLEEPPAHAIFILATTEKHKILPTILSRCQTYDFNRISVHDTVRYLKEIAAKEGVDADDESLHVIATKADGAMRDALTIFDQSVAFCGNVLRKDDVIRNLGVLDYEYSFKMVDDFLAGNYADAFLAFDEILTKGFNALHFVASLSSHLRDLVVAKTGGLESLLDMPDSMKQRYAQQASKCSVQFLFDALGITTACESTYKSAVNPRLHIEYALMRLSHLVKVQQEISPLATLGRNDKAPATAPASAPAAPAISSTAPAAVSSGAPVSVISSGAEGGVEKSQAPAPRRRATKTGSALSLNSIMEEKKEEEKAEEKAVEEAGKLPEDALVVEKWKEMAGQYADKPRLASTIANGTVNVREENATKIVDFVVKNEAQKLWIEEKLLRDLEGRLRGLLACNKVNIVVSVVPEEEVEKVPYMPEEKAKDLMDKNPDVRAFVADLGLDTK